MCYLDLDHNVELQHWCRFAITGSSDKLVRMWSIEEVYRQAVEAAWGVPTLTHASPAESARSSHTAAVPEDGQEVSQGQHCHELCVTHMSLQQAQTHVELCWCNHTYMTSL